MQHTNDDCSCEGKQCLHCNQLLCLGKFHKDRTGKYGVRTVCRHCTLAHRVQTQQRKEEYKAWQQSQLDSMKHISDVCICEGKRCRVCQQLICIENFHKAENGKFGVGTICHYCSTLANKAKYAANAEEIKANNKAWYAVNAERARDYARERYHADPEKERERDKVWRKNNPDKTKKRDRNNYAKRKEYFKGRNKQYKSTHREEIKQQKAIWDQKNVEHSRNYRQVNKERIRQNNMRWERENREHYRARTNAHRAKRRTRKTQAGGSYTPQEWLELKVRYSFTCLCCGRREPHIRLTADHIIPVAKGGSSNIDNIQPLCRSCNSSKKDKAIDYRPQRSAL